MLAVGLVAAGFSEGPFLHKKARNLCFNSTVPFFISSSFGDDNVVVNTRTAGKNLLFIVMPNKVVEGLECPSWRRQSA